MWQNPIQRTVRTAHLSVLMTLHNTTQNSSVNIPSYPQSDEHHSSDVIRWWFCVIYLIAASIGKVFILVKVFFLVLKAWIIGFFQVLHALWKIFLSLTHSVGGEWVSVAAYTNRLYRVGSHKRMSGRRVSYSWGLCRGDSTLHREQLSAALQ